MVAGVGTCHSDGSTIQTQSLNAAAAGGSQTLTVNNNQVDGQSIVLVSIAYGGAGTALVGLVTPGSGSFTVTIVNVHATNALNAVAQLSFMVFN